MTTTLIVLAHPEPRSFNGAWSEATRRACAARGDAVLVSDLCAMDFDPVERPRHYASALPETPFDPLKAQEDASATGALPPDVMAELDKVRRADRIILHFPLWWFGPPAILKGWIDRVFAHGATHDVDNRFDSGRFRGRKALFCVTTGSSDVESAHDGKEGDTGLLLWPMAYALRYLGFAVLEPVVVHGVHGYHRGDRRDALEARLGDVLDRQAALIAEFDDRPVIRFNSDADFDEDGRLRPDRPSHSPFIRHED